MKILYRTFYALVTVLIFIPSTLYAQSNTFDRVPLYQSFFRDAPISEVPYGNGFYSYSNYDFLDITTAGVQAGYAVSPNIEIGSGVYYVTRMPDEVDSESAIADIPVYGRYNFMAEQTKLSGGAFVTVPIGSKDIGEGNLNFGLFGALRHPLSEDVVLTGTLGIDFLDTAIEDYEASMNLGTGLIYQARENLYLLNELKIRSDLDYSAISSGINYELADFTQLRAHLLLGLDDTAPDFGFTGGLNFNL
ncbi:hypothetical protein NC796_15530 [Aliifodinibius sp. S!AR15-10]|uniref:hypothetical protein n=1 Tax=Aliifodinibius sp. S!AR15-10 TaxID=2950437 RepID=UPI00285B51C2|nr:hypothetical protein [Aliifodinibius sp. S!AR15-10]MDR8392566.1 hypothetical protein [Aliifodinibius sp. S!AR15-10]